MLLMLTLNQILFPLPCLKPKQGHGSHHYLSAIHFWSYLIPVKCIKTLFSLFSLKEKKATIRQECLFFKDSSLNGFILKHSTLKKLQFF